MNEPLEAEPKSNSQKPIDLLRKRTGGPNDTIKRYFKEQQAVKRAIAAALKTGPKSVPQIAREARLDPAAVLWHLMAMKRYGRIVEEGEQKDYPLYSLKES